MPEKTPARTNLSKKTRFEIFKRDSFTCQYCGRKAPDVVLQCDHIDPVAKGGSNDMLNLITSCFDCNAGKSDRRLSDHSVIEKQHQQLSELQYRKEQIEMMFEWQKALLELDSEAVNGLVDFWNELIPDYSLTYSGVNRLSMLYKTYSLEEIMEAMKIASDQYSLRDGAEIAFEKVGGICHMRRSDKEHPELKRLYYIRAILRNRFAATDQDQAIYLLKRAAELSASIDSLEECAKISRTWTQWRNQIQAFIENPGSAE